MYSLLEEFENRFKSHVGDNWESFALNELEILEDKFKPSTIRRVLTDFRNVVKSVDENHVLLNHLKLSSKDNDLLNDDYSQTIYDRLGELSPIKDYERMIYKSRSLCESQSYIDLTLGLCFLTGRRSTEILKTAIFTFHGSNEIVFDGQLKKKSVENKPYIIPTLIESETCIETLEKIRSIKDFSNHTNTQVNKTSSKLLSQRVKKHFSKWYHDICVHDLRAIYAEICYYELAPNSVDKNRYFAEILGHNHLDINTANSYKKFYLIN